MTFPQRFLSRHALAAALATLAVLVHPLASHARSQTDVYIADMTWTELRDALAGGATTVIIPIGGTEQSGPHIALGKHNVRAQLIAGKIAQQLGNAVVAPVIAYVPEGTVNPPAGHMRFPGTISIPPAAFQAVLEGAARSFRQHGFRDVVFVGDHGDYQKDERAVAERLNREWAGDTRCRVHALDEYYRVTQTAFVAELKKRGYTDKEIGTHAGLNDTALTLAVDKTLVRTEHLTDGTPLTEREGVHGDPRRATADIGMVGVRMIVDASIAAIRARVDEHRKLNEPKQPK